MDLRDYSTSLWSQPVPSRKLEKEFKQKTWQKSSSFSVPKLHSLSDVVEAAQHQVEVQRLTQLCQKPSEQRTPEDVLLVRKLVSAICPFFAMWPTMLQDHLAAMLTTEVLVTRENVLSRGLELTKMYIVLSGQLNVLYPDNSLDRPASNAAGPLASSARSQALGTPKPRAMGVLKKGDTCGEAILLGAQVSHADVVVASPMAVLLSLSLAHFLKAFKEMLGLRQQDRLDFLRCHPLFEGATLGDLDILAERLQCTIYPPRSVLLPVPAGEAPRTYMLAEGQLVVKRKAGGANWNAGGGGGDEEGSSRLYDEDTVCLLQQHAVVGSCLSPGQVVMATTQVKAYWLPTAQLSQLPPHLRAAIDGADNFWAGYHETRKQALAALDQARKQPKYGAYTYKVGDVVMSSIGQAVASPSAQDASHPGTASATPATSSPGTTATASKLASESLDAPGAAAVNPSAVTNSHAARRQAHLHALAAQQVLAVMDASLRKDPRTGLITSNLHAGRFAQSMASATSQHRSNSAHNVKSASKTFMTELPIDQMTKLDQRTDSCTSAAASATKCPPLGLLHPDQATWPRVACARPRVVDTQPATHQMPPTSLAQRHAAIHARALMSSLIRIGRSDDGDDSDDESEQATSSDGHRQPSRRLSGDHWRRSLSHSSSHGSKLNASHATPAGVHEHHTALQLLPDGLQQAGKDHTQAPATSPRKTSRPSSQPPQQSRSSPVKPSRAKSGSTPQSSSPSTLGNKELPALSPTSSNRRPETGTGRSVTQPDGTLGSPPDEALSPRNLAWDAHAPFGAGQGGKLQASGAGDGGSGSSEPVQQSRAQTASYNRPRIGVPASVVLGYEKMDPLQWAALASHAPDSVRVDMVLSATAARVSMSGSGPTNSSTSTAYPSNPSDSILPPPKW